MTIHPYRMQSVFKFIPTIKWSEFGSSACRAFLFTCTDQQVARVIGPKGRLFA